MVRPLKRTSDGRVEREVRVEFVVDLMVRGQWLSGVSDKQCAKQWGCTDDNARKISAEASRVLRSRFRNDPAAREEAKVQLLQHFEVIRAKAMSNGDARSLAVALVALQCYGRYLGIEPARQLDVTEHSDPFEGWTTEEKLAYSRDGKRPRRAIAKLAAMDTVGIESDGEGKVH